MEKIAECVSQVPVAPASVQCGRPLVDFERLQRAFDELDAGGIVARHGCGCCGSCGIDEIRSEICAAQDDGVVVRGFVFYHAQDLVWCSRGEGLLLAFGALNPLEQAGIAIGNEVVGVLRRYGLVVAWDGSVERRIHVAIQVLGGHGDFARAV